jgi:hypothetical protein
LNTRVLPVVFLLLERSRQGLHQLAPQELLRHAQLVGALGGDRARRGRARHGADAGERRGEQQR